MTDERYPLNPGPADLVELRATVTFTFKVWNTGDVRKSPEELAQAFGRSYALNGDELADALRGSLDHEVKVVPVTKEGD